MNNTDVVKTITIQVKADDAKRVLEEVQDALQETSKELEVSITADTSQLNAKVKETGDKVDDLTKKVKAVDKVGFGNVRDKFNDLVQSFKNGEVGVKGLATGVLQLGKALVTAFIANPILLAVGAIVGAVAALVAVFKSFTPVVEKVEQVMAGLKGAWNAFSNATIDLVKGNKSLAESYGTLGKSMRDAAKDAADLKKEQQDLQDQRESIEFGNEIANTQIQKLIILSKDRTKTEQERIDYLERADKLQQEVYERSIQQNEKELKNYAKALADKWGLTQDFADKMTMSAAEFEKKYPNGAFDFGISLKRDDATYESYVNQTEGFIDVWNAKDKIRLLKRIEDQSIAGGKEYENLKKSLQEKNKLEADNNAILERNNNKKNALLEKQEADAEKRKQAEIERITKVREAEAKHLEQLRKDAQERKELDEDLQKSLDEQTEAMFAGWAKEDEVKAARAEREAAARQQASEDEARLKNEAEAKRIADAKQAEKDLEAAKWELARSTMASIIEFDNAITQQKINNQDKLLKNGIINQQQYDKNVAAIQLKAAKRQKAFAIAQAIIDTAGAIVGFLKNPSGPAGIVLSIAAGIVGAAQIATILATPLDGGGGSAPTSSMPTSVDTGGTSPNTSFSFSPKTEAPSQQVIKTYVLSKDVNNQQQLDRQIVANGTI